MTLDEFDDMRWSGGMRITYKDRPQEFEVAAVCFEERLVAFQDDFMTGNISDLSWARCENVDVVKG